MKVTKPKNMPPRPIPALLFLNQPGSKMLLIDGWCHIICDSKTLYVNPKTIDAMIAQGWITEYPQVAGPFALYLITSEGRSYAQYLQESKYGYRQLEFDIKELQIVS